MTNKKFVDEFKNLYGITKTLRFGLIPVLSGNGEREIWEKKKSGKDGYENDDKIRREERVRYFLNKYDEQIQNDKDRKEEYSKLKKYLTELHKIFIKEGLKRLEERNDLSFVKLFETWEKYLKSNDDTEKENLAKEIDELKKEITKFFGNEKAKGGIFEEVAKDWRKTIETFLEAKGDKLKDVKDLIVVDQNVLKVLEWKSEEITENYLNLQEDKRSKEEILKEVNDLVNHFNGWVTYFRNFNEIRKNLYKDDGRDRKNVTKIYKANAGQITTRIIDENLEIFVKNKIAFIDSLKSLFKDEVKKEGKETKDENYLNFVKEDFGKEIDVNVFESDYYRACFLQTGINTYNEKIGKLNSWLNQEGQKQDKKVTFLKQLHKQILLTDGLELKPRFKEINSQEELFNFLFKEGFIEKTFEKVSEIKDLFEKLNLDDDQELKEVLLNTNKLSLYSNLVFGSWNFIKNKYLEFGLNEDWTKEGVENYKKERESKYSEGVSFFELKEVFDGLDSNEFKNILNKEGDFRGKDGNGKYKEGKTNFENFVWNLENWFLSLIEGRERLTRKEEHLKGLIKNKIEELKNAQERGERVDSFLLNQDENVFVESIKESIKEKKKKIDDYKNYKTEQEKNLFKKYLNEYFDRLIAINKFISFFEFLPGIENNFLNKIKEFGKDINFVSAYDNVRNYLTQKVDNNDKIKLTFEEQTLGGGWGYRTTDYRVRILRKNNKYYLLVLGKWDGSLSFDDIQDYEVMDYYQIKNKTIFGSVWKGLYGTKYKEDKENLINAEVKNRIINIIERKIEPEFPKVKDKIEKLLEMNDGGKFDFVVDKEVVYDFLAKNHLSEEDLNTKKKDEKKHIESKFKAYLIDKFGDIFDTNELDRIWKKIKDIVFKDEKYIGADRLNYELSKLENYFYKNSFKETDNKDKIDDKLTLFQIYNKDFSENKGVNTKNNLHTLYFKELFSEDNEKESLFKLSGGAEIFLNPQLEQSKWEEQELIKIPIEKRKYDKTIYKNRRKTRDNIYFHLPIELNRINKNNKKVNQKVNSFVKENEINVLGIDRGEKELAYVCLLDENGNIKEVKGKESSIFSLNKTGQNIVNGEKQLIDYHFKLDLKEKERDLSRKSWTKIEDIKELKQGYLSSIVKDLGDLIVDENAIVVLEDLNYGFKRGRMKIEKNIYQQFENALLNKLSYYVKEKNQYWVRNALQLVPPITAQKYWGKQQGVVYFTDAKFTSVTCPNCGFRRRGVAGLQKTKDLKKWIDEGKFKLYYEKDKYIFRVEYNWEFKTKQNNSEVSLSAHDLYGGKEVVFSDVERSYFDGVKQRYVDINLNLKRILLGDRLDEAQNDENERFQKMMENYNKEELLSWLKEDDKEIRYIDLLKQFKTLLNLRYKKDADDNHVDHIHCPKCHFHTASSKAQNIKDGDANGAYNIARKGILVKRKIKNAKKIDKIDLKVDLKEWDEFTYSQWDKKDWGGSDNTRKL